MDSLTIALALSLSFALALTFAGLGLFGGKAKSLMARKAKHALIAALTVTLTITGAIIKNTAPVKPAATPAATPATATPATATPATATPAAATPSKAYHQSLFKKTVNLALPKDLAEAAQEVVVRRAVARSAAAATM